MNILVSWPLFWIGLVWGTLGFQIIQVPPSQDPVPTTQTEPAEPPTETPVPSADPETPSQDPVPTTQTEPAEPRTETPVPSADPETTSQTPNQTGEPEPSPLPESTPVEKTPQAPAEQAVDPVVQELEAPSLEPSEPVPTSQVLADLPPIVDYDITVTLLPEDKEIAGRVRLIYTNHSPDIIADLRFHTYLNAFKNNLSTYRTEAPWQRLPAKSQSYLHISRAEVDGVDLTASAGYFQGPDSAPGDQTVWRIPLQGPLMPGQSTTVLLDFGAKLPYAFERMGYVDNFFFLAQWFPKIGVWETRGARGAKVSGWNCRPYHKNTEYYANFGNYRVAITVPEDYEVGATGVLVKEETGIGGKVMTFSQSNVHDFAFVAAEDLIVHERMFDPAKAVSEVEYEEAMTKLGLSREEVALKPVKMFFLYPPEQNPDVDRYFAAQEIGLKEFGLAFGAYPYDTITMLNPPAAARRSVGGMEYPTFITLAYYHRQPETDYVLEDLILHEFAHQYFYGMVATNEFEEAFLDEGFTTYVASKLTDEAYGGVPYFFPLFNRKWPVSDWLGFRRLDRIESFGISMSYQRFEEPIAKPGWTYFTGSNYGLNSYSKPALALEQLERELGEDTMAHVLRTYVARYTYQHPNLDDFQEVAQEVSGRDLAWFFDRVFREIGTVDYEAKPVRTYKIPLNRGYFDGLDGPELQDANAAAENRERQVVTVINNGTLIYPVEIAVHFEDGDLLTESWDGSQRWKRFYYDDAAKITRVVVDPEKKVVLDSKRVNNSYVVEPDGRWGKTLRDRLRLGAQHVLQTIAWGF